MTDYERSGQPWRDDPAVSLTNELYAHISAELGTDGPEKTFGHGDLAHVGHLVEDDEGFRADVTSDVIAHDSYDTEDLSSEELAMHYVDEDDEEFADLPDSVRDDLAERVVRDAS